MLRIVTLVLANGPGLPMGSAEYRYELGVQLDAGSRLNPEQWYADPNPWPATPHWPGEAPRTGTVQHDKEAGWSLHFDPRPELAGDASVHGVIRTTPSMRPGEYLTILEPDMAEYAYRIVQVA